MTTPADNDDDWAELARELARDKPPALQPEQSLANEDFAPSTEVEPTDGLAESDAGEAGDGPPGTGRKRRRRRRRRRKTGQPADESNAASSDSDDLDETESAEGGDDDDSEEAETGFVDEVDPDADTDVMVGSQVEADEDAGGELLRDLIANWNVPSWDDVVGSLYRPDR